MDAFKLASVLIAESIDQDGSLGSIRVSINTTTSFYLYEVKLDGYDHVLVSCADLKDGQPTIVVELAPCEDAPA